MGMFAFLQGSQVRHVAVSQTRRDTFANMTILVASSVHFEQVPIDQGAALKSLQKVVGEDQTIEADLRRLGYCKMEGSSSLVMRCAYQRSFLRKARLQCQSLQEYSRI